MKKNSGGHASGRVVAQNGNNNTPFAFHLTNTTKIRFLRGPSSTLIEPTSSADVTDGQWYHIAGIKDGNVLRLYVNANPNGTATNNLTETLITNANLQIGTMGTFWFSGEVDELRIYNRALSGTEVQM